MNDLGNLFDGDTVEPISNLIESKMPILNKISIFKEIDKTLADSIEKFENSLSDDFKNKLEDILKLNYQIDSYYYTLAYYLGLQHGKQLKEI